MIGTERFHGYKTGHRCLRNAGLRTARQHNIRRPRLKNAISVADTVRPRSAGRDIAARRPMEVEGDSRMCRRHVGDHHRNEKRTDEARPLGEKLFILGVHRFDPADAGTDIGSDALPVFFLQIERRILHRHG